MHLTTPEYQEGALTTKNSLLSTISFPSASNMLKAILKPAWGSEIKQNKNHISRLLTQNHLKIILPEINTDLLKCRAGRGILCN